MEQTFYDFVCDQDEVERFWRLVYDQQMQDTGLDYDSVFIYSYIITREKYMKDKGGARGMFTEQNTCSVGLTPSAYLAMINAYCRSSKSFYRKDPPPNCELEMQDFVIYSDVNVVKGMSIAQSLVTSLIDQAYHSEKRGKYKNICRFPMMQMKNAQNSRYWVDIDIDVEDHTEDMDTEICARVGNHLELFHCNCISTAGGMHVLIERGKLKKSPEDVAVDILHDLVRIPGHYFKEVTVNKAHSVPTPGTLQRGYKVHMV